LDTLKLSVARVKKKKRSPAKSVDKVDGREEKAKHSLFARVHKVHSLAGSFYFT